MSYEELLRQQDGVISRRQVLELGGSDDDIERRIRRREWARVLPGVYVEHTGPLTWNQRAWAGVLYHAPAALGGASALRAGGINIDDERDPIELVVPWPRRVVDPPTLVTTLVTDFDAVVLSNLSPPRLRLEQATLRVASRAKSEDAAVAVLGDVCQQRRTTAKRLVAVLEAQPRLRHRRLLTAVLGDVAAGTNSALDRYLRDVEQAHGLPVGRRQVRHVGGSRTAYRDVDYEEYGVLVELDGQLGHDGTADRWDDLDRDVSSAVGGHLTVRAGWRQVLDADRLAVAIGTILKSRGWPGDVHRLPGQETA
ncbi:MAG: hypothetical protein QOD98_1095 [Nocardioidaceae bacterium]|nr:hypothetical protein [Nocardioidaceae bacterium]